MRRLFELSLLLLALAAIGIAPPAHAASAACEGLEAAVAGFRFYQGPALLPVLQPGERLDLRRETADPLRAGAVAVWWGEFKLGYVESGHCPLADALEAGFAYEARVAQRKRRGAERLTLRIRRV